MYSFKNIYFIGLELIYNVVLIYAVQKSDSVTYIYSFSYSFPGLSQNIEYSSLCYIYSRTLLFIHTTYNSLPLLIPIPIPSLPYPPFPLATTNLLSIPVSLFCFVDMLICIVF